MSFELLRVVAIDNVVEVDEIAIGRLLNDFAHARRAGETKDGRDENDLHSRFQQKRKTFRRADGKPSFIVLRFHKLSDDEPRLGGIHSTLCD